MQPTILNGYAQWKSTVAKFSVETTNCALWGRTKLKFVLYKLFQYPEKVFVTGNPCEKCANDTTRQDPGRFRRAWRVGHESYAKNTWRRLLPTIFLWFLQLSCPRRLRPVLDADIELLSERRQRSYLNTMAHHHWMPQIAIILFVYLVNIFFHSSSARRQSKKSVSPFWWFFSVHLTVSLRSQSHLTEAHREKARFKRTWSKPRNQKKILTALHHCWSSWLSLNSWNTLVSTHFLCYGPANFEMSPLNLPIKKKEKIEKYLTRSRGASFLRDCCTNEMMLRVCLAFIACLGASGYVIPSARLSKFHIRRQPCMHKKLSMTATDIPGWWEAPRRIVEVDGGMRAKGLYYWLLVCTRKPHSVMPFSKLHASSVISYMRRGWWNISWW